jgi:flagellar basal body P-ring protein FlgI
VLRVLTKLVPPYLKQNQTKKNQPQPHTKTQKTTKPSDKILNENVNELFEITSKEELENDVEGLNKVLDWVK